MQTFLPTKNFRTTAKILDYRRLGKQRVECKQILNALSPEYTKKGWKNHPATLMWKGYENALMFYANCMIEEWISRGYNNTMELYEITGPIVYPERFRDDKLHLSHRMNLLRKDYDYYKVHFPMEDELFTRQMMDEYPYHWPSDI